MNEERLLILRMLEEGKIKVTEAAELLDALSQQEAQEAQEAQEVQEASVSPQSSPQSAPQPVPAPAQLETANSAEFAAAAAKFKVAAENVKHGTHETMRGFEKSAEEFGRQAERIGEEIGERIGALGERVGAKAGKLGDRLGDEIGERMSRMGESFLSLDNLLGIASWFSSGCGPKLEVTEEFTGDFAADAEILDVLLYTRNGSLVVEPWSSAGYKVVAVKKVQANSSEDAERISVGVVQVVAAGGRLEIRTQETSQVPSISLRAYLPAERCINLQLGTTNGSIRVGRLNLSDVRLSTTNGSIKSAGLHSKEIIASSTNGSIHMEDSSAAGLRISTTNGSIRWQGSAANAQLSTTNGSVRVKPAVLNSAPSPLNVTYKLTTHNGSAHCDMDGSMAAYNVKFHAITSHGQIRPEGDWVLESEKKTPGSREMSGRSQSRTETALICHVELETSNGSINISR